MWELIWHQPCNELSHRLSLVIYSLNGDKNLPRADKLQCRTLGRSASHINNFFHISNEEGTFLRDRDTITKFIHSTVRRLQSWIVCTWHFPVRAKVEKRKHMQRASSMSRRASMKEGYLPQEMRTCSWVGTTWNNERKIISSSGCESYWKCLSVWTELVRLSKPQQHSNMLSSDNFAHLSLMMWSNL